VTDGRADNADHYNSWLSHCGGPANKIADSTGKAGLHP